MNDSPRDGMVGGEPLSRCILLVEDHEPTRTVLTKLLERRNYLVKAAATAAEARRLAASHAFQLLISDIGLPDGNGFDLMSEFRVQFNMKGIALTGYGTENDLKQSRAAGFEFHLIKPVRVQSLEQALSQVFTQ